MSNPHLLLRDEERWYDMKKIILSFFLAAAITAPAQNNSEANDCPGWLWEISGNGLAQKSYLFGTCHGEGHNFTKEEVFSIPGLQDAFDKSQMVLFETDMNPEHMDSAVINKQAKWIADLFSKPGSEYMMPEGVYYKTLYDSIDHFNEVDNFLAKKNNDPEYWKKTPGYWFTRIGVTLFIAARRVQMVDDVLYQEVINQGKENGGLEELKDIDGTLNSMFTDTKGIDTLSMKEQADTLYRMIRNITNGTTRRMFRGFYKVYVSNDTCQMARFLAETPDISGAKASSHDKELLNDRNAAWMAIITKNIPEKTCMIAVGARHLMGAESLIAMLRRKGYTVEAVK